MPVIVLNLDINNVSNVRVSSVIWTLGTDLWSLSTRENAHDIGVSSVIWTLDTDLWSLSIRENARIFVL